MTIVSCLYITSETKHFNLLEVLQSLRTIHTHTLSLVVHCFSSLSVLLLLMLLLLLLLLLLLVLYVQWSKVLGRRAISAKALLGTNLSRYYIPTYV